MKPDPAPKLYLVRAGRNGEDEATFLDNNTALIGFVDVADTPYRETIAAVRAARAAGENR
jgi:predicted Mrr-cat superfamily restriction endonuclease